MEKLEQVFSEGEADSLDSGRGSMEWNYSHISADEEDLIIRLHKLLGDRWTLIAGRLPWRTKEEIEKYWKLRSYSIDSSESSD
ncbi:hypothetical protein SUGI_0140210 [Cryptomeria japonica]|uniref:MYB-like transcription factor ETC3 n=1 Tax=Cryptomeria japonica TaxID=3369 RepID=UPI002408D608|nr:MYB-like transcription factor ETC3 [Cryptomeria japonica]XP_057844984.1 MYB-like transcription factor ETC3 [Cryptomeria japonica]XP_059072900.1 MYB-like transcription factor ETC3 [Cryptomeria japonica]XP_059072901.1 MYB-like transcription factor ETC3 [Cryptomeria japonica]GLJ11007.1 hypothetical protein SUGI_0140210 [Cryptomeria japonica]